MGPSASKPGREESRGYNEIQERRKISKLEGVELSRTHKVPHSNFGCYMTGF